MSHYVQLLNSSRLSATRRERLTATYNDFVKAHLDSFWLEWDREEACHEFDVSCETVTKRTAALAQKASLAISARGFSAVQANNSTGVHNLPTDAGKQRAQGTGMLLLYTIITRDRALICDIRGNGITGKISSSSIMYYGRSLMALGSFQLVAPFRLSFWIVELNFFASCFSLLKIGCR